MIAPSPSPIRANVAVVSPMAMTNARPFASMGVWPPIGRSPRMAAVPTSVTSSDASVATKVTSATTTAFAKRTSGRFGIARNVVRIRPLLHSDVMLTAPKTAMMSEASQPIRVGSDPSAALARRSGVSPSQVTTKYQATPSMRAVNTARTPRTSEVDRAVRSLSHSAARTSAMTTPRRTVPRHVPSRQP